VVTMEKGLFIAIEGLDGSGSSTQCEKLRNYMDIRGMKTIVTKEPTNNLIGGLIRGVLTHDWTISPAGLQLLFCADRAHHLEKEIMPALEQGISVICDRYMFSTLAFGAMDCELEWLKTLNKNFMIPDLTFILEVNPAECVKRIGKGRSKFELFEQEEKLRVVLENYRKISTQYPRMFRVNGENSPDTVLKELVRNVEEYITKKQT
jgi:dTMP kinase